MNSKNLCNITKFKTIKERLAIVVNIVKQLKQFPKSNPQPGDNLFIDLYNIEYSAIKQLKDIFSEYIHQDDSQPNKLIGFSGKIYFEEINRDIEYILPIKKHNDYMFTLKFKSK
jgi:hypothetical protein